MNAVNLRFLNRATHLCVAFLGLNDLITAFVKSNKERPGTAATLPWSHLAKKCYVCSALPAVHAQAILVVMQCFSDILTLLGIGRMSP